LNLSSFFHSHNAQFCIFLIKSSKNFKYSCAIFFLKTSFAHFIINLSTSGRSFLFFLLILNHVLIEFKYVSIITIKEKNFLHFSEGENQRPGSHLDKSNTLSIHIFSAAIFCK